MFGRHCGERCGAVRLSLWPWIASLALAMTAAFLTIELSCHHPRMRMIQYSRDVSEIRKGRGVLDAPLSRSMTTDFGEALLKRANAAVTQFCARTPSITTVAFELDRGTLDSRIS
jgi:hypothetical protein